MKNIITIVLLMLFTTFAYKVNAQALAVTQHAITSVTGKTFNNTSKSNITARIADANQQKAVATMIIQSNRIFDTNGVFQRQINHNQSSYKQIKLETYKVKDIYNSKKTQYVYPTYKVDKN